MSELGHGLWPKPPDTQGVNVHATKMVGLVVLGAVLAGMAPLAADETIPAQELDGKIKWLYSYDDGKSLSRQTGKPLFVVFRSRSSVDQMSVS